jgi:hypothetical protein
MQKAEIDVKIKELRAEFDSARGTNTEVYTRIVGYYRSVKNWNAGKREEYGVRKLFAVPAVATESTEVSSISVKAIKTADARQDGSPEPAGKAQAYMLFERETCPNCPPVMEFMRDVSMSGIRHNVDTEDGLNAARLYGVMASPTVIFFDAESNEVFRAHSVADLKLKLPMIRA